MSDHEAPKCPECGHYIDSHASGDVLPVGCHVVTHAPPHRCPCRLSHGDAWRAALDVEHARLAELETRSGVAALDSDDPSLAPYRKRLPAADPEGG